MKDQRSGGPLSGLRVVEFAGLGPGPFACMLLADMGADVVTVDRPGRRFGDPGQITGRNRRVLLEDLKQPEARERVLTLLEHADALVEGFRPGVMERMGLGPDVVAARNPRLVYGRMTGWGQAGPRATSAGHDINYIALAGALEAIGPAGGPPVPPLNLVGDYGGGSLYLVVGLLAALHEARQSGRGQVVDAAIVDGTLSLMTLAMQQALRGQAGGPRGTNLLDGGEPYYGVYETADAKHVAIGPIEPQFFAELCEKLSLEPSLREAQRDRARHAELRAALAAAFRARTRDEWAAVFEGSDACVTPVLSITEAAHDPHVQARGALVEVDGVLQPAPAPRFSRTPSTVRSSAPSAATSWDELVEGWADQDRRGMQAMS